MIKIDTGTLNGLTKGEDKFLDYVLDYLRNDDNLKKSEKSLGRCYTETTWSTDDVSVTWRVDSSD